jgi:phage FluMu protein Com
VEPLKPKAEEPLEERCLCGNLLAKVSREGIEILCRRCKRIHRIPWPWERKEGKRARKNAVLLRG